MVNFRPFEIFSSVAAKIVEELAIALFVATATIAVVDVYLRKDFILDVEEIFSRQRGGSPIDKMFAERRDAYSVLAADIENGAVGDHFDTCGVTERALFVEFPGN